ncbi:MAG TPA: kelch repeat-containing protein [Candidatus Thermoplasmatota archaeon]|nr:kelch repeat-containing protein [Candidatus Thermoplasmatota archaeon]
MRATVVLALLALGAAAAVAALALRAPADDRATPPGPDSAADDALGAGAWEPLPEMALPRTEASAVAAAGRIWVIGGLYGSGTAERRVDVFDPAAGTWDEGPDLPLPLHHAPAVAVGDRILVLGGFVASPAFAPTAQTWSLDAASAGAGWVPFTPLPAPRGAAATATDGRNVWIFGGVASTPVYAMGLGAPFLDPTVLRIDATAAGAAWTAVAPFPDPRDHLAGAFADGKVFAIGGRDLTLDTNTGRVDVYDPASNTWSEGPPMPTPRGGLGAAAVGARIVAIGGENPSSAHDEVEVFDVANGTWSALAPLPEPRHGVGVAALDGNIYVAAGGPQPAFVYSATLYRWVP